MTKPITGVAMMMLYEQGKWLPSDPIAKFIPEFAHLKVYKGMVTPAGNLILTDPDHPPTMRELMTHTAGFTYGFFGDTPVDKMYRDANLLASANLQEFIDKLAKIPLLYQPGQGWTYSMSMDVQGYIVEESSRVRIPARFHAREHIPAAGHARRRGFYVPAGKARPLPRCSYRASPNGELTADPSASRRTGDYDVQPPMPSGGGGMVSTAEDYYRFATMLLNSGELDGKRILSPATVKLMTSNHVPSELLTGKFGIGSQGYEAEGFGYGYDLAVVFDPLEANLSDGKGTFFWGMEQRAHGSGSTLPMTLSSLG